jgi:hypothetical protein
MTNRHSLDPDKLPARARRAGYKGHNVGSIGPSDSSDSGSDLQGPGLIDDDLLGLDRGTTEDSEGGHLSASDAGASIGDLGADDTSDRNGTGEHLTAGKEPDIRVANDIAPDRIVGAEEAGLGGGLDQAEEAQLGITDEELAESEDLAGSERLMSERLGGSEQPPRSDEQARGQKRSDGEQQRAAGKEPSARRRRR